MDRRARRRQCADLVADLPIPTPFDVNEFCAGLGRDAGRPIHLLPMDLPPGGPCGLLLSTDDAEYVVYPQATIPMHQQHIVFHELGHFLLQHRKVPAPEMDTSRLVLPNLDPVMVQRILSRTAYSEREEQDAEVVASLILERVSLWTPQEQWEVPEGDAPVIDRVLRTLSSPKHQAPG